MDVYVMQIMSNLRGKTVATAMVTKAFKTEEECLAYQKKIIDDLVNCWVTDEIVASKDDIIINYERGIMHDRDYVNMICIEKYKLELD